MSDDQRAANDQRMWDLIDTEHDAWFVLGYVWSWLTDEQVEQVIQQLEVRASRKAGR